jgi:hypothetical protein
MLPGAAAAAGLEDWGPVLAPLPAAPGGPVSRTRGVLLHRGPDGFPEAGLWECTPGRWECRVTRDEFCHFLAGRCVYTDAGGGRTEIRGGDAAFFPAGWAGTCEVLETVRKVYLIR